MVNGKQKKCTLEAIWNQDSHTQIFIKHEYIVFSPLILIGSISVNNSVL